MTENSFRLPGLTHRTTVIGRTGSGKTVLGAWLLSEQAFDKQPFIIIDYKLDDLLNSVDRIQEIGLNEIPKHAGLYIVHPEPVNDDDAIEDWMRRVWARGRTGLYIDEAYMLPDKGALQSIYTQGRSKRIPVITLTQRPKWLSRFAFSEADFFALFHLQDADDRLAARRITSLDSEDMMEKYWSRWRDVSEGAAYILKPAPSPEIVQQRIHDRLKPVRKWIK